MDMKTYGHLSRRLPCLSLVWLDLLLVHGRWLPGPARMLGLHLPLLGPGQGSWGSGLGPVVARLLGQQLDNKYLKSVSPMLTSRISLTRAGCSLEHAIAFHVHYVLWQSACRLVNFFVLHCLVMDSTCDRACTHLWEA